MPTKGPRFLQGHGCFRGELLGGCVDVLASLVGTPFFPAAEFEGRFLMIETSEEKPAPEVVCQTLRNFGLLGIIDRIAGVLLGRCRDYEDTERDRLEIYVLELLAEYGRGDIPLVTDLDFGHTDPQHVLPLGVPVEVDCDAHTFRLTESAVEPA